MTIVMNPPRTDPLEPSTAHRPGSLSAARITGVATAVTDTAYTQSELLDIFRITDPKVRSVFLNSAIEKRFLSLPRRDADGICLPEKQSELLDKHKDLALDMGARAIERCLANAGIDPGDVDYLCVTTTTGFLTPGLSALLIRSMGLRPQTSRVDIVGMGCNAGLNALQATAGWAVAHPGQVVVMLCVEVCSAAYVIDSSMRTAVVNSLFGDGAAAVALIAGPPDTPSPSAPAAPPTGFGGPRILGFASHLITDAIDAMRYDWDDAQGKFSFYLDPHVPYVVGAHAEQVVDRLLAREGLRRTDISHWLVHSGGKKVIDSVRINLGLTRHDVRHTTGVLRDYGNLSSGSFLFSYERLLREDIATAGEYGVLMTMGPGSTIETALVQW
ncbi:stilbene synthase [Streptomyces sp. 150FB]|uniref:3,5-dihydroxyphenylacetyl-CoA synthase DpgA n=1 Tax=Streptomyces sp. 150FB TaxID=1576605 RepID=UPI000589256E|nr:3,5-dihydroxyphenylacetyl-CoA synthase DpgA [Streptomyces sp. 150FB]KIF78044.1 stilbene synthase [Streptomyces sp. 150FB]